MNAEKNEIPILGMIKSGAVGLLFSVISAAILLPILALICYSMPDPDKYTGLLALTALYISVAAGGMAACGKGNLISALISGLMLSLIVLLSASFAQPKSGDYSGAIYALLYIAVPAASALGAILRTLLSGRVSQGRRKNHSRRKHR